MIRANHFIKAMIASVATLLQPGTADIVRIPCGSGGRCRNRQYTGRYKGRRRYTRGALPGYLRNGKAIIPRTSAQR